MTFEYQQVAVTSNLAKFGHFRVEVPISVTLWGKDHLMDACESLHVILCLAQKYFKNALMLFHGFMFHYIPKMVFLQNMAIIPFLIVFTDT